MKAFIISLPDSRRRRISALNNIQISGLPFEIVDGVDARKMKPEFLSCQQGGWGRELLPGEVGCYAAHLRVLQRIIDYDLPWGYVLEDDFCYEPDPKYGLVEVAAVLPNSFDYITLFKTLGINPKHERISDAGSFWRVREPECMTTGYIIHRRFAEFVLNHHAVCTMPVDHLYASLSHVHECFEVKSPIVGISAGLGSEIHDRE